MDQRVVVKKRTITNRFRREQIRYNKMLQLEVQHDLFTNALKENYIPMMDLVREHLLQLMDIYIEYVDHFENVVDLWRVAPDEAVFHARILRVAALTPTSVESCKATLEWLCEAEKKNHGVPYLELYTTVYARALLVARYQHETAQIYGEILATERKHDTKIMKTVLSTAWMQANTAELTLALLEQLRASEKRDLDLPYKELYAMVFARSLVFVDSPGTVRQIRVDIRQVEEEHGFEIMEDVILYAIGDIQNTRYALSLYHFIMDVERGNDYDLPYADLYMKVFRAGWKHAKSIAGDLTDLWNTQEGRQKMDLVHLDYKTIERELKRWRFRLALKSSR